MEYNLNLRAWHNGKMYYALEAVEIYYLKEKGNDLFKDAVIMVSMNQPDEKGKEMFSNDIIKSTYRRPHEWRDPTREWLGVVEWVGDTYGDDERLVFGWIMRDPDSYQSFVDGHDIFEVVGNTFENPELNPFK